MVVLPGDPGLLEPVEDRFVLQAACWHCLGGIAGAGGNPVDVIQEASPEHRAEEVVEQHVPIGHVPVERHIRAVVVAHRLAGVPATEALGHDEAVHAAPVELPAS